MDVIKIIMLKIADAVHENGIQYLYKSMLEMKIYNECI